MLIQKANPSGIDIPIQNLQEDLYNGLISASAWNLADDKYSSFPRCYRNKSGDSYIAENYVGGKEYKEVWLDDRLIASSFFGTGELIKNNMVNVVDVHLVFFVNLAKLYPSLQHRADEEARLAVQRLVGKGYYGMNYKSTEIYLANVLKEYPGSRRDNRLLPAEMHPWHCFRLNFEIQYDINICP